MITDSMISDVAASQTTFQRGYGYYISGRVKKLIWDESTNLFRAEVQGSRLYFTAIVISEKSKIESFNCDCPAFEGGLACKHIIASLKTIKSVLENPDFPQKKKPEEVSKKIFMNKSVRGLLEFYDKNEVQSSNEAFNENEPPPINVPKRIISLIPTYEFYTNGMRKSHHLEFKIGVDKLYVLKDLQAFFEAMTAGAKFFFGKNFEMDPKNDVFDEKSQELYEFLYDAFLDIKTTAENHQYYGYSRSASFAGKAFSLTNSKLRRFFEIMKDTEFDVFANSSRIKTAKIIEGRPAISLEVESVEGGTKIQLNSDKSYFGLDAEYEYIYNKGQIYKVDEIFSKFAYPLLNCFAENGKTEILISSTEDQTLFSSLIPSIEKIAKVNVSEEIKQKYFKEELESQVYFDKFGEGISAKVVFKYGENEYSPFKSSDSIKTPDGRILIRNKVKENKIIEAFKGYEFKGMNDVFYQLDEESIYDFMLEGLEIIRGMSQVFYSEDFKNISLKKPGKITAGVRINSNNLLELNFHYEDCELKELLEMLAAFRKKKKYHRLVSGQFLSLENEEFRAAAEMLEQLNISNEDLSKETIILPKFRAMYIDSLTREKAGVQLERSSAFKKMVQEIGGPQDMEFDLPDGIQGKLRDYQKIGFKWLKTLTYYGFGGILADDMGLGKTLQVLTFVMSEKASGTAKRPSLVVAPTSLVYNWKEEVKKFVPSLNVVVLSGQQLERRERFNEIAGADIVVTSYGMIKRDIDLYKDFQFEFCFIDEAQHIKNPLTQNAKAVKLINARGFFALTGTPIENTLTELWSIFDFIMPGYLLSHGKFLNKFEKPIVKEESREALKELARHIKPFIMRRMKKDVLLELPEKIESKMMNEMTEEQKKVYTGYLVQAKKEFEEEVSSAGFENSRIKILAILTRLRQVCCHPSLFIDDYQGGSGKIDMFMELVEDAIDGGHRILVFSQFTSMLALIKRELGRKHINYHYLDGSTSAEERMRLVNSFNAGENELFLISLKAGGTGLNLTGADMVIHYDPWWNPAVEDQATDRAYRIGQKNVVQVFKLITKDTIEEKIFELQEKKKELIDSVIKPGETFITKMSEADIRQLFELDS